jgi:hypothetical protein
MRRPLFASLVLSLLAALPAVAAPPAGRSVSVPAAAAGAAGPRLALSLAARAEGEIVEAPGAVERAELLTFDDGLAAGLLVARPDEAVHVAGWPVAPGERADVVLTRREIYADGAETWELGTEGPRRVPRSRLVFFWGAAEDDPLVRVMVSVDPDSRALRGMSLHGERLHELQPTPPELRARRGQHLVAEPDLLLSTAEREEGQSWSCAEGELPEPPALLAEASATEGEAPASVTAAAITSLHTATVAFDTDNQVMSSKFGNNTTTATNYIASLVAAMNVVYERDLLVRLVVGTTFLRTAPDPWADTLANTTAGLNELSGYWRTNYGSVPRAVTAMLSLRGAGSGGIAGVAWVDALCSTTYGYSFTKVQNGGTAPSSGDVMVIAHEIGHNFGSPHTHCYSRLGLPLPDTCRSGEGSGCYSGAQACPAPTTYNGVTFTGSLMSYCHLIGCSSSSSMMVFHPTTVGLLDDKIQARVGACIVPAGPPPTPTPAIAAVSPNSGSTAGGTTVTITGSGFDAADPDSDVVVTFGGTRATNVNVTSSTRMTVTLPARATGAVTVAVTNPDGKNGSRANAFFYAPPPPATGFYTVTPCRLVDTRNASGPRGGPALPGSGSRVFTLTGACNIPATARALSLNVTVVTPGAAGYVEGFPGNAFPLGTTVLGFRAGQTRAANATLLLATDGSGRLGIQNGAPAAAHVLIDVNGYYQ